MGPRPMAFARTAKLLNRCGPYYRPKAKATGGWTYNQSSPLSSCRFQRQRALLDSLPSGA